MIEQTDILSVETTVQKAVGFLQASQGTDGAWRDFHLGVGIGSQWVTAYVCHSTAAIPELDNERRRAIVWLLAGEYACGGWGFNENVLPDGDSTANALMAFTTCAEHVSDSKCSEASIVLKKFFAENQDGGCSTYVPLPEHQRTETTAMIKRGSGWCAAHPSVTALATEALLLSGLQPSGSEIEGAVKLSKSPPNN